MATRVGFAKDSNVRVDIPVTFKAVAGEDIGYPAAASDYPLAPVLKTGFVLFMNSTDGLVYLMDATAGNVDKYIGISETAAKLGEEITVRVWGIVWLPVGSTLIAAGELVKADISAALGDVIPWVGHTDLVAGDNVDALIGKALAAGAVRAAAVYELVPVLLRGF